MAKKMLKRNLLTSLVAMALSMSMFVGTTFAWFTDSVTSTNNIIKTGNLDVELYYQSKETANWTPVGEGTNVFMEGALWEPGHTEVVKLKVVNEGTLALKYQLGVNVASETGSINVEGNPFMLSDFIKYGIVADGTYTRESAIAAAEAGNATLLKNAYNSGTTTLLVDDKSTAEVKENEKIVTMVVYMPEEVGNEANYKKGAVVPQINLGINLYATQVANENDSFGPDYDDEAWVNGMKVFNANDLQAAISAGENVVVMDNITLTEPIVISAPEVTTYSLRATPAAQVIDLNGKAITAAYVKGSTTNHVYAFENYGNIVIKNGTINARGIFNYGTMTLENGAVINAIDGNGGYAVRNYEGAKLVMNAGTTVATTLEDDYKVSNGGYDATTVRVDEGAEFVMNGGVINNICDYTFAIDNYGKVTVNDGVINSVHSTLSTYGEVTINGGQFTCNGVEGITAHVLVAWNGSTTVINGGTFNGKDNYNGFNVDTEAGAVVDIYGGNFLPVHSGSLYGKGTINVYGGTYFDDVTARVVNGYQVVNANGTYYVVSNDVTMAYSAETLKAALTNGGNVLVANDIAVTETITVANGKAVVLEMNGNTIAFENQATATHNDGFLVKGELTVKNGTVTINHAAANMGWNGATTAFDVTAGGVLNIENATVENLGGTDMNFAVHLNNWGEVSLNVNKSTLKATYIPVRVFNSGNDVNNVTIENSTLDGGNHSFWVHNYASNDFGGKLYSGSNEAYDEAKVEARLNFDIYGNNNTFIYGSGKFAPVRYGFNSSKFFTAEGEECVGTQSQLQAWLNSATGEAKIILAADITGDVTVTQKEGVAITINGNDYNYNGVITVDGKSARYETAALTIENVNFAATTLSADAFIRLGYVDAARYTNNVTVKDCTFSGNGFVAVKSYTGGDHNVTLKNLTVNKGMHSLAQFANVEQNLKIVDCKVYSKNGVNLNNGLTLAMSGCEFDVQGYAIRFGVNGTVNESQKSFTIENSTLKSACAESDDAVIVFRDSSKYAKLTLTNTALVGAVAYKGVTSATTILVDGLTLTAVSGYSHLYTDTAKNFYVYDAEGLKSLNNWFEANKYEHAIWGKTFNIMADIDAAGMTWNSVYLQTPNNDCVGFTLNGNNSTISNLTISGSGMFSGTANGANNDNATIVKNLTFDNATVSGGYHVGIVWGQMHRDIVLDNVHVTNSSITGTCNVGALIGRNGDELASTITFKNCSVTNTNVTANGNGDPNGASVFLGSALTIETGAKPATIKLAFEGCTQSGNTLTSAAGQVGGGIYACWNVTTNTYNAVNDFTNFN